MIDTRHRTLCQPVYTGHRTLCQLVFTKLESPVTHYTSLCWYSTAEGTTQSTGVRPIRACALPLSLFGSVSAADPLDSKQICCAESGEDSSANNRGAANSAAEAIYSLEKLMFRKLSSEEEGKDTFIY